MKKIEDFMNDSIDKNDARRRLKQYLNIKNILGINRCDFWIYLVFLLISILTIIPYCFCQGAFQSILMSFGCSMLGAVLLAYFLALRSERTRIQSEALKHNKMLYEIYGLVYSVCESPNPLVSSDQVSHAMLPFLKGREKHDEKVFVELTDILNEYFSLYGEYIDKDFFEELKELGSQINEFSNNIARVNALNNDVNTIYQSLIVGIPDWLNNHMNEDFIKKHYIG